MSKLSPTGPSGPTRIVTPHRSHLHVASPMRGRHPAITPLARGRLPDSGTHEFDDRRQDPRTRPVLSGVRPPRL
uniref:Membrane protein n=1 Tax=Streptomyces blastmyceticus TaxID=68180 RepID=A0A077K8G0_9ACTN|nr:membrane protein [Streptomyces blastmyceticus]